MLYSQLTTKGTVTYIKIKELLYHKLSHYQDITIANYPKIGKALIIDSELQSSSMCYESYHTGMILNYTPASHERVLVLGAGEGILVDQLLRKGWKNVTAVELDPAIPEACRDHLSDWNNHIYKRLSEYNLIIGDGLKHLKDTPDAHYSYILFDLNSPAITNQHEWCHEIYRCLLPNGALSFQDGDRYDPPHFSHVAKEVFENTPDLRELMDWRFGHVFKK